jgi:predicted nucleic acid-binding Zn ribbon protein
MKRTNTVTLGDALKEYIKVMRLESKFQEIDIVNQWESVVGTMIAHNTSNLHIQNKKLFVTVRSSVMRAELFMIREELVKRLNGIAGKNIIDEIILK